MLDKIIFLDIRYRKVIPDPAPDFFFASSRMTSEIFHNLNILIRDLIYGYKNYPRFGRPHSY